jgi:integrase/recombinase XerD
MDKGKKAISKRIGTDILTDACEKNEGLLSNLFSIFIRAKKLECLRERTLKDHSTHFKYFSNFLAEYYPKLSQISQVDSKVIRDYVYFMTKEKQLYDGHKLWSKRSSDKKGLSPVTVNIRLRTLKCFLKFLADEGYIHENPTNRIKLLKTEEDTIEAFTKDDVIKLLQQPDQQTYTGFRDYVLMLTFLDTGIRCNEALNLCNKDFNFEQKILKIPASIAKNTKSSIVPLSIKTAKLINILLKENKVFESEYEQIFLSNYGEPIDDSWIRQRIKEYGNITNVRVSPHVFRHTFAKFYILNGGDAFKL